MMGPTRCDEVKHSLPLTDSSISPKCPAIPDDLIRNEKLSVARLQNRGLNTAFSADIL